MESIPRKTLRRGYHCSLALLGLTCLLGSADARPMLAIGAISRSLAGGYARGSGTSSSKQSRCLQSGRGTRIVEQSRRISLYCTSDEKLWTSWRVQPAARTVRGPAGSF
jgi:hypothetical protein